MSEECELCGEHLEDDKITVKGYNKLADRDYFYTCESCYNKWKKENSKQ